MNKINYLLIILVALQNSYFNTFNYINKYKYKEKITKEFDFESGSLEVFNQIGKIKVESFDKNKIEVILIKKANKKKLLQDIKLSFDFKNNKANIKSEINKSNINELTVSINIKVPKNTKLENLTTKIGAIFVKNIDNSINVKTETGSITLSNINGNINAQSDVGSIKLNNTIGQINTEVKTGYIELSLPKNTNSTIKAKTNNGKISSDFKEINIDKEFPYISGKAEGKLGNGQNKIDLSTQVGAICIKKI